MEAGLEGKITILIDLYDLFLNPDKSGESDPDHMLYNPCSEYFSIDKLKKTLETMPNSLSILHCNIRSLPKNLNVLEDILYPWSIQQTY